MKTKFNGILTLLLAFAVQFTFAQSKTISGTVSDDTGSLPGVSIIIKGTQTGTETDFDGNYSITTKAGDVLRYSFVGMKSVEKTVGAANTINVTMESDNLLDEVIVTVAYGEKKRKDIIGAVSVVTAEEVADRSITTVTEALQGTSGLSLVNTSGQPGSSPTIVIRGPGSLNGSSSPLIIVDGAEYTGNINAINFNDVSTYSVLKDADAVSLYGNRGANGVIIISTKTGGDSSGKSILSVETSYGFSEKATDDYSFLSAEDILKTSWVMDRNDRLDAGTPLAQANQLASAGLVNLLKANPYNIAQPIGVDGLLDPSAVLLYETDYTDALTQSASRQEASLSVRGGTDKSKYYVSGSALGADGYGLLSKFQRYTGRMNVTSEVKNWLTVGGSAFVSFSESNVPIQSGSRFSNNTQYIRSVSSIYPLYQRNPDGSFILDSQGNQQYDFAPTRGFFGNYNPLADTFGDQNTFLRNTVNVSPNFEVRFTDDLKFNTQFNYNFYLFEENRFVDELTGTEQEQIDGRSSTKERSTTKSYNVFNTLTYNKTFNEKHNLTFILGQELFDETYNFVQTTSTGFVFNTLPELNNGNAPTEASSLTNQSRLFSYFSRADYNFNEKYYVGGSVRRDASSRFSGDNKWGTFWSAAVGWSIYDEFFQDSDVVNTLKLRASYGVVGNQNINNLFPGITEFGGGFNVLSNGGFSATSNGNPNLKWETHNKLNVGLDFGFFNNRLNGSIEVYDNKIEDLIYNVVPAGSTGSDPQDQNLAALSNKGVELTLNSTNVQNEDFKWTTSLAVSTNKNEITTIPAPELSGSFRWAEGRDRYEFYMREWAGVNPANGEPLWFAEVTDPITGDVTREITNEYNDATRVYTGKSALPDFEGRFGTNFKYKNLDLGLGFNFKFGHYIYNSDFASLMRASNPGEQLSTSVLDYWTEDNRDTNVPRLQLANNNFNSRSTRWLQKGDYVRLKNVTLGLSLEDGLMKKFNLNKFRVYLSADNYFTWTKENNIDDPEQTLNGLTSNSSTILKTLTLGVNVSF